MRATRIVIFAKAPMPGLAKTRLAPALGEAGAARLAHRMLLNTAGEAFAAGLATPELCCHPHSDDPSWAGLLPPQPLRLTEQGEGDLGLRLGRAAARAIGDGENVVLIGTDCPGLDRACLRSAAQALAAQDAVIFPATDGGYVLLGLRRFDPSLFEDIAWSTSSVAETTIARIRALGWSLHVGDTLADIDAPDDLALAGLAALGG